MTQEVSIHEAVLRHASFLNESEARALHEQLKASLKVEDDDRMLIDIFVRLRAQKPVSANKKLEETIAGRTVTFYPKKFGDPNQVFVFVGRLKVVRLPRHSFSIEGMLDNGRMVWLTVTRIKGLYTLIKPEYETTGTGGKPQKRHVTTTTVMKRSTLG